MLDGNKCRICCRAPKTSGSSSVRRRIPINPLQFSRVLGMLVAEDAGQKDDGRRRVPANFLATFVSCGGRDAYDSDRSYPVLRTQLTIAPNFFSKLTKLKTKFGISCSKEWVNRILKSIYHPVLCISYLVFVLVFLENLTFGLRFG